MLIGICCQRRGYEEIVSDLRVVVDFWEETNVIGVAMPVELAPDDVGISLGQCIESH